MNTAKVLKHQSNVQRVFDEFRKRGYLSTNEISNLGVSKKHIPFLIEKYHIQKVKRGLYEYQDYDFESLMEKVANIVPKGVFCLATAFDYHNLSTDIVPNFQVAVPKGYKITIPDSFSEIDFIYLSNDIYELGIMEVKIGGNMVKIYEKEKCVCDAVKFRNKIVEDVTLEVLSNYFKDNKDVNLEKLFAYAKTTKTEKYIKNFLKNRSFKNEYTIDKG